MSARKNYIRHYREAAGLTLEELGDKVGASLSAVQRWETGKKQVSIDEIRAVADALEVHYQDILYGPPTPLTLQAREIEQALTVMEPTARDYLVDIARTMAKRRPDAMTDAGES